jgi:hypothetical protein
MSTFYDWASLHKEKAEVFPTIMSWESAGLGQETFSRQFLSLAQSANAAMLSNHPHCERDKKMRFSGEEEEKSFSFQT